jgi:PAS domain S-box-containing protein
MSNVPVGINKALEAQPLNRDFAMKFQDLNATIFKFATEKVHPIRSHLVCTNDARHRAVLTNGSDKPTPGYLFVPAPIIHGLAQPSAIITADALNTDPALKTDIALTDAIADQLQDFVGTNIALPKPVTPRMHGQRDAKPDDLASAYLNMAPKQVYIITTNGVLRIFNRSEAPRGYRSQFPATTFFPNRPYFWATFDGNRATNHPESSLPSRLGDYFVVSEPYMDLGGNGIVITASRGIALPNLPQAIICFDFAFLDERSLKETLVNRVNELDGDPLGVECVVDKDVDCKISQSYRTKSPTSDFDGSLVNEMKRVFQIENQQAQRSDIFGTLQLLNEPGSGELHVSVPLEEHDAGDSQVGQFLLFSVDLTTYRLYTLLYAAAGASAFGVMTLLLAYFWGSLVRQQKEYEEAFARVAGVMAHSPTAYARVDGTDRIREANSALADLVGFTESALTGMTFEDLVADESKKKYEEIQEKRRGGKAQSLTDLGEDVFEYQLTLRQSGGGSVSVMVISASIPSSARGGLPETFGILVHHHQTGSKTIPFLSSRVGQG